VALLKKYGIKIAFGTDLTGPPMRFQNKEFTLRAQYWAPAEVLLQATGNSSDTIAMCGLEESILSSGRSRAKGRGRRALCSRDQIFNANLSWRSTTGYRARPAALVA